MAENESVKLFVGQVPKHMAESQLLEMFKEFAAVDQVNIIRDRVTRASRGCCFVICPSREEADKIINACHNKKTLPGASSPLQVKYADGELERLENKLFIGMLPKNVSEDELSALFSQYGTIKDLQILRGSQQTGKGCAFIKFEAKDQALEAIEALNGKHKMEGSIIPLVVKWADTEKERQARRSQKAMSEAPNLPGSDSGQHPSVFGALPMSYMPPYNGYAYQNPGPYGLMQYRLPQLQNHNMFPNMVQPLNRVNAVHGAISDVSSAQRNYAPYVGSPYQAVPGIQYPLAYPRQVGVSSNSLSPAALSPPPTTTTANSQSAPSSSVSSNSGGHIEGFVSYDSAEAAQSAIITMNGFQLGGKKLKVQLKRDNNNKRSNNSSSS